MVGPRFLRKLRLRLRGDRCDDAGPQGLGHLDQEEDRAARAGMDQEGVSLLQGIGGMAEVVGRHALEHRRCARLGVQALRQLHQTPRRRDDLLRV